MLLLIFAFLFNTGVAQESSQNDSLSNPLSFMDPFMGSWAGDEFQDNPEFKDMIGFHFEWAKDSKEVIYFYEGYNPKKNKKIVESFVSFNPFTKEVEFMAFNYRSPMLFKGTFNQISSGFERRYKVWYPTVDYLTEDEKKRGGFIEWADTCKLLEDGIMHCKTERIHPDGKRTPYDPKKPDGWTMKRKDIQE